MQILRHHRDDVPAAAVVVVVVVVVDVVVDRVVVRVLDDPTVPQTVVSPRRSRAANTMGKTNELDAMAAQIKALTDTVAKLVSKENKNPNVGGGGEKTGDRDRESRRPQATKLRNMGAYCHSHSFHPVGANHNSTTCGWKRAEATWGNRLGGDMYWPTAKRVAIEQQEHPTWKEKAAPTV